MPPGEYYKETDLLVEEVEHLMRSAEGRVAERLGFKAASLERRMQRAGRHDLARALLHEVKEERGPSRDLRPNWRWRK